MATEASNEGNDSNSNTEKTTAPCIDGILNQINEIQQSKKTTSSNNENSVNKSKQKIKRKNNNPENNIPRGQPKSGRPWKSVKEKFSNVKKSMYKLPFKKKMELRNELKHIKELSNSIIEERKQQNEMKKQRRLENEQRRLENERRAEVVQVIKNPAKLKRMRKKQLRMIEKRDLSKVKVV